MDVVRHDDPFVQHHLRMRLGNCQPFLGDDHAKRRESNFGLDDLARQQTRPLTQIVTA